MIYPKKPLGMAKKKQKETTPRRRRKSFSSTNSSAAKKGHFVVYTVDNVRFIAPLACLDSPIFVELFNISEEEFGLPCGRPITLPCSAVFLEYAVSLIQRSMSKDVERALLASIVVSQCSISAPRHGLANHGILLRGF